MTIRISELNIYPIKSAGQIALQSAKLTRFGFEGDRRWMVVDELGKFITQRENAAISLIRIKLSETQMELAAPSMPGLTVNSIPEKRQSMSVKIWLDQCDANDMGDEVAHWLSEYLSTTCRLVHMPETTRRPTDPGFSSEGDTVSFADGFPLLLISEASLSELSDRIGREVEMNRFRPNIVVSGCDAFAEDLWGVVQIGGVEYTVAKPCARCSMPTIDQETGKVDRDVMTTLASFRRKPDGQIYLGQNLISRGDGVVNIGDELQVLS